MIVSYLNFISQVVMQRVLMFIASIHISRYNMDQLHNLVMNKTHCANLIKFVSVLSVIVASIVLGLKIFAFVFTESVSILASLIDSALDVSVSVMNFLAIKYSLEPPDDRHRFGHEKIQDLAIFAQSIFFFGSGIFTIIAAIQHLVLGVEIKDQALGTAIMLVSIVITIALIIVQSYVIRITDSNIIKADKLHYMTDFLTNSAVVIGVYLSTDYPIIDIIFGTLIALYIIYGAYRLFSDASKRLIDEECDDKERQQIIDIIKKSKDVKGLHDLKTRKAGNKPFIQFHLELDGRISLLDSHEIAEQISEDIEKEFQGAEIIIHQDPEGIDEEVQYRESLR